jgi:hypothetical protein
MLDILIKYGIKPEQGLDPQTLIVLRKEYMSRVEVLEAQKKSEEDSGDSLLKQLSAVVPEASKEKVEAFQKSVRSALAELLDDSSTTIPVVEALQELKSEAMSERDFQIAKVRRVMNPSKTEVSTSFVQKKDEAKEIAELIRNLWTLLSSHKDVGTKKFREEFPVKDQKEDGKPTGQKLPNLPMIPRTPGETTGSVGMGAVTRRLRFSWNGEDLPEGTLFADVAHDYVSDRKSGFIVDPRAISDLVEKTGNKVYQENKWTVEFPVLGS